MGLIKTINPARKRSDRVLLSLEKAFKQACFRICQSWLLSSEEAPTESAMPVSSANYLILNSRRLMVFVISSFNSSSIDGC